MAITRLMQQAAAGNAAGEGLYVEEVFSTYLYEGNGSTQTITNGIDLDGEGGLVWTKARTSTSAHGLYDTERGVSKEISSSSSVAESSDNGVTAFNSDGYVIGNRHTTNSSGVDYASWTFRKAPKFFDVVTYTGTGSDQTISHNLGSVPGCIIIKDTSTANNWIVWHNSIHSTVSESDVLVLNTTTANTAFGATYIETISSSSFVIKNGYSATNTSGRTYVAYLFAHNDDDGGFGEDADQDIIKCGSYSGSNQTIDLGFEPQFIIVKRTDSAENWMMFDSMRGWNADGDSLGWLMPNASNAESTLTIGQFELRSNGFFTGSGYSPLNGGSNYIYIAIRRGPMKTPESGTEVFDVQEWTGDNTSNRILSLSMTPDAVFHAYDRNNEKGSGLRTNVYDRLRGTGYLQTYSTSAQGAATAGFIYLDLMDGVDLGDAAGFAKNETNIDHVGYYFKRAPGFFDAVAYTGTGANRTVDHNLGVVPELLIVKRRSSTGGWIVYSEATGNTGYLRLENSGAVTTPTGAWNNTSPTTTNFSVGTAAELNTSSATYIAYLFATLPGVSKVGSYTGNNVAKTIDCGFSSGARFVLVKKTNAGGNWYLFDSERGIVSGNDPFLYVNETDSEYTSYDLIDPDSSGFALPSTGDLNSNNDTYIFLAIA